MPGRLRNFAKNSVEHLAPSPTSLMPEKLLDPFSESEVLDLFAYLLSRGNASDPMFRPQASSQ